MSSAMYVVAFVLGAVIAMYLLSGATLWVSKGMGDSARSMIVAHAYALLVALIASWVVFGTLGVTVVVSYGAATLFWMAVDLRRLKRREAGREISN
jgi:hypothetical protein